MRKKSKQLEKDLKELKKEEELCRRVEYETVEFVFESN